MPDESGQKGELEVFEDIKDKDKKLFIIGFTGYDFEHFVKKFSPLNFVFIDIYKSYCGLGMSLEMIQATKFDDAYALLEDAISKEVFYSYLLAKLGNNHAGLLRLAKRGYFTQDFFTLNDSETLIDIGGYTGDSVAEFVSCAPVYRHIYTFEPNVRNFAKLCRRLADEKYLYVSALQLGASETPALLTFPNENSDRNYYTRVSEANPHSKKQQAQSPDMITIETIPLDSLNLAPSFIKIAITGGELDALKGLKKTIKSHHPKIAVYCHCEARDITDLALYIKAIAPSYKFYLRNFFITSVCVVLYAV